MEIPGDLANLPSHQPEGLEHKNSPVGSSQGTRVHHFNSHRGRSSRRPFPVGFGLYRWILKIALVAFFS